MTLLDVMSREADGTPRPVLSWPELARFMRGEYWDNKDNEARKKRAAVRQAFYAGRGDEAMYEMLGQVFRDKEVIALRSEWIAHAKFNNVLRRAVNELATVYSAPAARNVDGDDNNARYQEMQRRTRMHEVMQRVNRLGYLHRAVFAYPRIRMNASGVMEPVLEVVTPDRFDAICHPKDPTMLVAVSIDLRLKDAAMLSKLPRRMVITATEFIEVDEAGHFVEPAIPHTFGRIPGVLYCVDPPTSCLIDSSATEDLESAHRAVWFENILLLKESKSATKMTIVTGDASTVARNQVDDSEGGVHLADGMNASTMDRSMDLSMFRDTARNIYETAAANHGIPPQTLNHGGVQSADARELTRIPLKEIRLQQHVPLRDVERDLAEVQALVYAPIDAVAFTTDGWGVDFADPQTPLGQKEALEVFKQERELGFTSTIAEVMHRNPDLTREAAKALVEMFNDDETWRRKIMQERLAMAGSLGPAADAVLGVDPSTDPDEAPADDAGLSWVEELLNAA